ncbi:aryl-sulfate sulfotransferase [Halovivax cerinus]|uniref:Aryl-sulfate sulfotransferase n=1 Tax=Halovivax cerinus TaxID=1487865 RepID=A0ABD5NPQ7_9EURY|nr:aryl-sulfate sulfotransferase [Halovivax cerinus]
MSRTRDRDRRPFGPLGLRSRLTRNRLRIAFGAVIILAAAVLVVAAAGSHSTATRADVPRAPPTENHTVVTESGRAGTITVYDPGGDVRYYDNSRTKYFDVDPVASDPTTIEYAATDTLHRRGPTCRSPPCTRNVIERVDLAAENPEPEVIYARYDHRETAAEWHDHVRINETHVAIADIVADQVFVVNTETELVEWLWDAQAEFPVEEGGPYPDDWAHVNDVEYVDAPGDPNDGRIVASLRNQDQVVFLDPETGLVDEWTLGAEDDYDVQYEQHNPDYIPESRGGPAIVVADSENGRVQEFGREDGEWVRTWQWADETIQWPRDADRLPNGNTIVADSHGQRVIEVDPSGEIVWEVPSTLPYEAERLETGAESTGGRSAASLGLESRTTDAVDGGGSVLSGPAQRAEDLVEWVLPHRIYNALLFATPVWMDGTEFAVVALAILVGLAWLGAEVRWRLRDAGVRFRAPVYRRGD